MAQIGVIADSHLGNPTRCELPSWVTRAFHGMDLILHAGDIVVPEVLSNLEALAPVYAVKGNMDGWECRLPLFRRVEWEGNFLVLAHRLADAYSQAKPGDLVLVHGHTHVPEFRKDDEFWVLNPGSPFHPRSGNPPSVAILEILSEKITVTFKYPTGTSDE